MSVFGWFSRKGRWVAPRAFTSLSMFGGGEIDLRDARDTFERLGARPWADRAGNELRAAGVRSADTPSTDVLGPSGQADLTPQERQIVRLAARGLSNKDIAAQLFLSPRTVGYHLYKAYPKLGVASRAELVALD
ncbi:helix-turn-helix transcriptional regulator [Streptosporangium canum]|uniref:helix-turn-helix transcriptional regulator n=1 Tax=Streptosporangium canum TaxID=324952 RepID=UPI0034443916